MDLERQEDSERDSHDNDSSENNAMKTTTSSGKRSQAVRQCRDGERNTDSSAPAHLQQDSDARSGICFLCGRKPDEQQDESPGR